MTKFPKDFLWGGAIAANQAEGSRNAMVVRLLNDGMFNVAEPDSKREPGKK